MLSPFQNEPLLDYAQPESRQAMAEALVLANYTYSEYKENKLADIETITIIGAGILSLPYLFSKSGFLLGVFWLLLLGVRSWIF